jgi:hypothetical protein
MRTSQHEQRPELWDLDVGYGRHGAAHAEMFA